MKHIGIVLGAVLSISLGHNLLVWADAQIVVDPDTKKIYVISGEDITSSDDTQIDTLPVNVGQNFVDSYINSGSSTTDVTTNTISTGIVNTGLSDTGNIDIDTGTQTISIATDTQASGSSEFSQALTWMYTNGLTQYTNASEYRPDDYLTREEAAKIIGQAYETLGYSTEVKNTNCSFSDNANFDPSLSMHITQVCQWELFVGSEGEFMPQQTLTKAQAATVLVRMLEGKMSDESKNPWWSDYYKKAKAIGLTESSQDGFDEPISRRDVALFVYRIRNIVSNEQLKVLSLNSMLNAIKDTGVNTASKNVFFVDYGAIADNIIVNDDPELEEAINWMKDNGLTSSTGIDSYRPFDLLLREQAAKVIVNFAGLYGDPGQLPQVPNGACNFQDSDQIDPNLVVSVDTICSMGLLLGSQGEFKPKDPLTKAHFVVALMRLLQGKHLDESTDPWRKNYYELALQLDIVSPADVISFNQPITRYEAAVFLYRFKVKYLLLKNINNSRLQNEIITTLSGSIQTGVTGLPEAQVYINTVLLSDNEFSLGYMEAFGDRFKLVKTSIEEYYTNNFVWYGDVFSIDQNVKVGTIALIVSNGLVVEGNIRFTDRNYDYLITPVAGTQAYYALRTVARIR